MPSDRGKICCVKLCKSVANDMHLTALRLKSCEKLKRHCVNKLLVDLPICPAHKLTKSAQPLDLDAVSAHTLCMLCGNEGKPYVTVYNILPPSGEMQCFGHACNRNRTRRKRSAQIRSGEVEKEVAEVHESLEIITKLDALKAKAARLKQKSASTRAVTPPPPVDQSASTSANLDQSASTSANFDQSPSAAIDYSTMIGPPPVAASIDDDADFEYFEDAGGGVDDVSLDCERIPSPCLDNSMFFEECTVRVEEIDETMVLNAKRKRNTVLSPVSHSDDSTEGEGEKEHAVSVPRKRRRVFLTSRNRQRNNARISDLECDGCGRSFVYRTMLDNHAAKCRKDILQATIGLPIEREGPKHAKYSTNGHYSQCPICQKWMQSMNYLGHIVKHDPGNGALTCPQTTTCPHYYFANADRLSRHRCRDYVGENRRAASETVDPDQAEEMPVFEQTVCTVELDEEDDDDVVIASSSPPSLFLCPICEHTSSDRRSYNAHQVNEHGIPLMTFMKECPHCPAILPNEKMLNEHVADAHKEAAEVKPVERRCKVRTVVIGSGELSCAVCEARFEEADALTQHRRTCFITLSCQQPGCLAANKPPFQRHGELLAHMKEVHSLRLLFKCSVEGCPRLFDKPTGVPKHIVIYHEKGVWDDRSKPIVKRRQFRLLSCPHCTYTTKQGPDKLRNHLNRHPSAKSKPCALCAWKYGKRSEYTRHLYRQHGHGRRVCDICYPGDEEGGGIMYSTHEMFLIHLVVKHDIMPEQADSLYPPPPPPTDATTAELSIGIKHPNYNGGGADRSYFQAAGVVDLDRLTERARRLIVENQPLGKNEQEFACHVCQRTFVNQCKVDFHMKTHNRQPRKYKYTKYTPRTESKEGVEIPWQICPHVGCILAFTMSDLLLTHRHNSHGYLKCQKCGKCMDTEILFNAHLRTHTECKPRKVYNRRRLQGPKIRQSCPNEGCNKTIACAKSLLVHIAVCRRALANKLDRPIQCAKCTDIKFTRYDQVQKHRLRMHADLGIMCVKCNHEANTVDSLLEHIRAHHQEMQLFKCDVCAHLFTTVKSLDSHRTKVHGPDGTANVGGAHYRTMSRLGLPINAVHAAKYDTKTPRKQTTPNKVARALRMPVKRHSSSTTQNSHTNSSSTQNNRTNSTTSTVSYSVIDYQHLSPNITNSLRPIQIPAEVVEDTLVASSSSSSYMAQQQRQQHQLQLIQQQQQQFVINAGQLLSPTQHTYATTLNTVLAANFFADHQQIQYHNN